MSYHIYLYICIYVYVCIYSYHVLIYAHPPPPPTTRRNAHFAHLSKTITVFRQRLRKSKNPKTQNSKNPKTQTFSHSRNLAFFFGCWVVRFLDFLEFWNFGILEFWIFGILDFWMLVFWMPRLVNICTPGPAFPCTVGARVRDNSTICICTIYIYTCALAKAGFCSGGRISCKPTNGALLSTSINKNDDSKILIIVHCLVPVLIATMIIKVLVPVWIY